MEEKQGSNNSERVKRSVLLYGAEICWNFIIAIDLIDIFKFTFQPIKCSNKTGSFVLAWLKHVIA